MNRNRGIDEVIGNHPMFTRKGDKQLGESMHDQASPGLCLTFTTLNMDSGGRSSGMSRVSGSAAATEVEEHATAPVATSRKFLQLEDSSVK